MTLEEHLKKLREIDVRDIDPSTLVDIKDVHIDTLLPVEQRLASVLQQMNGNPYFFRSNGPSALLKERKDCKKFWRIY